MALCVSAYLLPLSSSPPSTSISFSTITITSTSIPPRSPLFLAVATKKGKCKLFLGAGSTHSALTTAPRQATLPLNVDREPHKYFDQATIVVRSGDGGDGVAVAMPPSPPFTQHTPPPQHKRTDKSQSGRAMANHTKNRKRGALKKAPDGSVVLPMGGQGGDVVLVADASTDSLLAFHQNRRYKAKRGCNVDAMGFSSPRFGDGASAPTLQIRVPVGTVVKTKKNRGGKFLADLASPGDVLLVARGGRGGISILEIPKTNKKHLRPMINAPVMTEPGDKVLMKGAAGEEMALELTLRVVADVGLVGLPNAGKSSLLAATSLAKPQIAHYPFTTLMPNLGRIGGDPNGMDGGFASGPTVADLPGLIKGAHLGKGLGRVFLRHLRRTKLLVHVVDVATEDPVKDYSTLREELEMYNPEYLFRPHIVALNKLDLPEAQFKFPLIKEHLLRQTSFEKVGEKDKDIPEDTERYEVSSIQLQENRSRVQASEENCEGVSGMPVNSLKSYPAPVAVVGISCVCGSGILELLTEIRNALQDLGTQLQTSNHNQLPNREYYKVPQWRL